MASKKAGGSSGNGRDSNPQNLGVKKFGGENVLSGNILVRQKGNKFFPGENVQMGRDFTLFATENGQVRFSVGFKRRKYVNIVSERQFLASRVTLSENLVDSNTI